MKYDFDKVIKRQNTNSIKYDYGNTLGFSSDIQPMWIADMDFETAPCIVEQMKKVANFGVYGYSFAGESYFDAIHNWYNKQFNFDIKKDWLVYTPGVVFALNLAIKAFTNIGDSVMIQQPVYSPFSKAVKNNDRKLVNSPLIYKDNKYTMDFNDIECKIKAENVRLFILCSPHNPVGRVWSKSELLRLSEICLKYKVIVVSDEIHNDFVFKGEHTVFAKLSNEALNNCVICTSPSKTFNIAGIQTSNIIIPNGKLREKFNAEKIKTGYDELNIFGIVACQVAYNEGGEWLQELLRYIENNYLIVKSFLADKMPKVEISDLEGTFLVWLNFSKLGFNHSYLYDKLLNKAKVWLDDGAIFGNEGQNFMRLNIACPQSELIKALNKIYNALYK